MVTVSLNLHTSRWGTVVVLVAGQYTGAALAACLSFLVYWEGISWFEHQIGEYRPAQTAQIFSTFPLPYISLMSAFFDQFLGKKNLCSQFW